MIPFNQSMIRNHSVFTVNQLHNEAFNEGPSLKLSQKLFVKKGNNHFVRFSSNDAYLCPYTAQRRLDPDAKRIGTEAFVRQSTNGMENSDVLFSVLCLHLVLADSRYRIAELLTTQVHAIDVSSSARSSPPPAHPGRHAAMRLMVALSSTAARAIYRRRRFRPALDKLL